MPGPGNVRELANVLQRAALVNESDTLDAALLGIGNNPVSTTAAKPTGLTFDFGSSDCTLASVEKKLLTAALSYTQGNVSEAARLLGVTRGGFRHRMEKLGVS